ncbi:MAG TPA: 50S ribosomal protein L25 [Armatimonadota bacterium]|jgi:large subunit ribosomal protein L25
MKHVSLDAWTRVPRGNGGAHVVRAEGFIPAVLIGHHEPAVPIKVKKGDMTRLLKEGGRNALVDLSINGEGSFAILREFKRNPISRAIIHIDFQRVSADETIEAAVPVTLSGLPEGEFELFVPSLELSAIQLKAHPDKLPGHITVDVNVLLPNHPLHARDLQLPDGVELVLDGSQIVAVLNSPTVQAEPEATEAAVATPAAEPAA